MTTMTAMMTMMTTTTMMMTTTTITTTITMTIVMTMTVTMMMTMTMTITMMPIKKMNVENCLAPPSDIFGKYTYVRAYVNYVHTMCIFIKYAFVYVCIVHIWEWEALFSIPSKDGLKNKIMISYHYAW